MGDREDLADAVEELGAVLKNVVFDRPHLVLADVLGELREAWERASAAVRSVVTSLRAGGLDLEEKLATAGLLGSSLRAKLRGFKAALARWRAGATTGTLLRVLGWGNVFLGSLASVLPGAEVLKEYKEAVEQSVLDVHEQ
ncbi:MAG: hypothetical protein HYY14_05440 [Candidatus Omnitrophica bacterium]|nr:hypothetical protein [Candidatus Omnitrophota bacterium]